MKQRVWVGPWRLVTCGVFVSRTVKRWERQYLVVDPHDWWYGSSGPFTEFGPVVR